MDNVEVNQLEIEQISNKNFYLSVLESLLFVSGEPLKLKDIASILECDEETAEAYLKELAVKYDIEYRGIRLINLNNEYQLVTKSENSGYIQKLLKTNVRQSLSQAALETIAIIAYKQPVTRVAIDEIRGVKSDAALATLLQKGIIKECGRLDAPGKPILYSTTDEFLRHFGLENIEQIPSLDFLLEKYEQQEIFAEDNNDEIAKTIIPKDVDEK